MTHSAGPGGPSGLSPVSDRWCWLLVGALGSPHRSRRHPPGTKGLLHIGCPPSVPRRCEQMASKAWLGMCAVPRSFAQSKSQCQLMSRAGNRLSLLMGEAKNGLCCCRCHTERWVVVSLQTALSAKHRSEDRLWRPACVVSALPSFPDKAPTHVQLKLL